MAKTRKRVPIKKRAVRKKPVTRKKAPAKRKKKSAVGRNRHALVVTVSGDRPIHDVAKELKAKGFEVGQVLDSIGSVTGFAHPKTMKRLQGIRGVADVSKDHAVDIGPPGAPVS